VIAPLQANSELGISSYRFHHGHAEQFGACALVGSRSEGGLVMNGSEGRRVAWFDYAKGICIVGVVALYATMYVEGLSLEEGWMSYGVDFAQPVRMPTFFQLCGLFLARTIDRPWRDYLDKKIVHFLYFFVLWTSLYFAAGLMSGEFDGGAPLWVDYLGWYVEPFHMLWFIQMLPVYFLVTRLARPVPWVIVLAVAALLQIWGPESGWRQLDRFSERFVYFYAGYLFAPFAFRIADWARANKGLALLALASWGVINELIVLAHFDDEPVVGLALGFLGAGAVIAASSLLAEIKFMDWLRYLGEHSIVIFLSFFVATVITSRLLDKTDLIADVGTETLLVTALSVALPIFGYWIVRRTPLALLFDRPRWAIIPPKSRTLTTMTPAAASATMARVSVMAGLGVPTPSEVAAAVPPTVASVLPVEPIGPSELGK
jgi:uncharacterized membrane protein YcfT